MHKSASSMTSSVGSQPPTARKSARRKNMAWSPNSNRTPRRKSCGQKSRGAYQVLIQLWKLVPQRGNVVIGGPVVGHQPGIGGHGSQHESVDLALAEALVWRKCLSAVADERCRTDKLERSLSTGRLARRRWSAAGLLSTAVSFSAGPMVRIRFPPAKSQQTFGSLEMMLVEGSIRRARTDWPSGGIARGNAHPHYFTQETLIN